MRISRPRVPDESGLGLIEIVVSIFLLALLAMAFLPLIVRTLTLSRTNVTLATSIQVVNQQLDLARGQASASPTCASLSSTWRASITNPPADARGIVLHPAASVVCPASYPGTATVTITVAQVGSTAVLASATTLIYVKTAT